MAKRAYVILPMLLAVGLFCACRDKKDLTASQQAEMYYNMLLKGQYEDFILGTYGCDSLPAEYLSQRVDLLAQHVKIEQKRRGGYVCFEVVNEELLSDSTHLVYLDVLFGDSSHERISCALFRKGDRWLMRN